MTSPSEFPTPSQNTVNLHLDFVDQAVILAGLTMLVRYGREKFEVSRLSVDQAAQLEPTMDAAQALIERLS